MKNRYVLGAGLALAVAFCGVQAQAQMGGAPGGFYFGGEGGWTSLPSRSFTTSGGILPSFSGSSRTSGGYNIGGRVGYEWGPWRFEEEVSYRHNGIDGLSGFPSGYGTFSGSTSSVAVMTNVLYDFDFGWPLTPHIGAGVGAVDIHEGLNNSYVGTVISNDSWQFGYQAIAGVRYRFNHFLSLDVDYRYLGTTGPSFKVTNPTAAAVIGNTVKVDAGGSNNIVASLTVLFGAPPPPKVAPVAAPAPPPPPPPREFLVFFDWDRYNITNSGMAIVEQAAKAWKAGAPVKIRVNGYTDLSGSAGYNLRLSIRRANAVANALSRLGIPRSDMDLHGYGESNPRVPTAQGVREPQNRRVEILFQ